MKKDGAKTESSETVENFKAWKGHQMPLKGARCPPHMHVGDIFRSVVSRYRRKHRLVKDATVLQRRATMVAVAAQFFWATQQTRLR